LKLAHKGQKKHLHNTGWIRVYKNWKQSTTLMETWEGVRHTYCKGFQSFWDNIDRDDDGAD
jgi:hypothetical protein